MAHAQAPARTAEKTTAKPKITTNAKARSVATATSKTAVKPKAQKPNTTLEEALEKIANGENEVVVYKNGKKAGAVISARAYRFLVKATEEEMDRRAVEKAEKALQEEGEITHEEIKKKYGIK